MRVAFHSGEDPAFAGGLGAGPGSDEVAVWTAVIPSEAADWPAIAGPLSPDERARAGRFHAPEARRTFVFGRSLLRRLLAARLAVEPDSLSVDTQPGGKPFLLRSASAADLRFNVSHSSAMIAIGLALGIEVGVDIERIQPMEDLPRLADRIFSARERAEWQALPEPLRLDAFFRAWTCKEAYVKATGEGLAGELSRIEVQFLPGQPVKLLRLPGDAEAGRRWAMHPIPLPPGYTGAVVFPLRSG
jgi:4'-phosphopantetheinyl transferase